MSQSDHILLTRLISEMEIAVLWECDTNIYEECAASIPQDITALRVEAAGCCETLVPIYQTIQFNFIHVP
jgi:hypothetical protein